MSHEPMDRSLASWLHEQSTSPTYLDEILERTRHERQRPAWSITERWIPMLLTMRQPLLPRPLLYLGLLVLALAAVAAVAIGARPPVAPPFGLAANGLIAFDREGFIAVARSDGTDVRNIVTTVPDARGPVYAPDGSRLAFYGTVDGKPTILVSAGDGRAPVAVSQGIVLDAVAMETPPSWSPDSQQLVFGGLVGEQRQLFVAQADGSRVRAVGDSGLSRMDPSWSPDGRWLAFHGFWPAENIDARPYRTNAGLYLIRPDGREETTLIEGEGGDFIFRKPQWLPDPRQAVLAYAIGKPSGYDIALFDVGSGTQTVISDAFAAELWPVWSPDGSTLAWAASDGQIRFARADGSMIQTVRAQVDYQFVWSPDGEFLLGFDASGALVTARTDGSPPTVTMPVASSGSHWSWQRLAP